MRRGHATRAAWLAPALLLCAAGAAVAGDLPEDAGTGIESTRVGVGADAAAGTAVDAARATESVTFTVDAPPPVRSGTEIVDAFLGGLSDDACGSGEASARWRKHFAASPRRLAESDDTLALFGYVVDALREVHLPTEYALIPFVESGYAPGARSKGGPAGMWQFIALTARNHKIPVRAGYDGRMSPVASTRAAVRYLRTLHGMFAGDWRLAAMAFNAGEYRILGALRRGGMAAASAEPSKLPGLSGITYAYPRKMHALSCLLQEAGRRDDWRAALDRPVPRLEAVELPGDVRDLDAWGQARGLDMAYVRRLNPAWTGRHVPRRAGETLRVLVPAGNADAIAAASASLEATHGAGIAETEAGTRTDATPDARTHVVRRGDSLWTIARKHGVSLEQLRALNTIGGKSVLQPGMILRIDAVSTDAR
jgi:membrane-bound lytic murein transglycosylase D